MYRASPSISRNARGYTLVEITIVVAILSGMSLLLTKALQTTQQTDGFLQAAARASERGRALTYSVTSLVSESRHLYEDDDEGRGYIDACDFSQFPLAPQSRLPRIDADPNMQADAAADVHAGNMLLFVREINASTCIADKREGRMRWIDTYRMVAVYPTISNRKLLLDRDQSRDLVLWRSVPFASLPQLMEIGDEDERESIVKDLATRYGITHAWDPGAPIESAFIALSTTGRMGSSPARDFVIEEDEHLSEGPRLVYAGVQLAPTDSGGKRTRGVLVAAAMTTPSAPLDIGAEPEAEPDPESEPSVATNWAPHGFEVKIGGPSGARKVWMHTVVEAAAPNGRQRAIQTYTTTAHVRDF